MDVTSLCTNITNDKLKLSSDEKMADGGGPFSAFASPEKIFFNNLNFSSK